MEVAILADGVRISAQSRVAFAVPVWAGGCAWKQLVPAYTKNPAQFPQLLNYITQAAQQVRHEPPLPTPRRTPTHTLAGIRLCADTAPVHSAGRAHMTAVVTYAVAAGPRHTAPV